MDANVVEFDLYSILAVTHRLPSTAQQCRKILSHITGSDVPSVGLAVLTLAPACARWLLDQHPQLREIPTPPDFGGDESAMNAWAIEQANRIGVPRLPVAPVPPDWAPPDVITELTDQVGDRSKVVIYPTGPGIEFSKPADERE